MYVHRFGLKWKTLDQKLNGKPLDQKFNGNIEARNSLTEFVEIFKFDLYGTCKLIKNPSNPQFQKRQNRNLHHNERSHKVSFSSCIFRDEILIYFLLLHIYSLYFVYIKIFSYSLTAKMSNIETCKFTLLHFEREKNPFEIKMENGFDK